MSSTDEDLQRSLTRTILAALDGTEFALAGSGAIREHGIVDRLTDDIDVFSTDISAAEFDTTVNHLGDHLRKLGHGVEELRRAEKFAQLLVTMSDGRTVDIDLGVDWREEQPARLSVGAVLSLHDAIGSKVNALYSRAEARDFLDVDSIRRSGRMSDADILKAAADRDAGFESTMFATQLEQVQRIGPDRVARYGVDAAQLDQIKNRFRRWAADIRTSTAPPTIDDPVPTPRRRPSWPTLADGSGWPPPSIEDPQQGLTH